MQFTHTLKGREFVFESKPGLFSKDGIDIGTQLLIKHMIIKDGDTVIDLGCGYGPIGLTAASLTPHGMVYMVDVDIRAITLSRKNAQANHLDNVTISASDGFEELPKDVMFNVVVSNPPTHMPKETLLEFLKGSSEHLLPGGTIFLVTEKRVAAYIKRELEKIFGNHQTLESTQTHTIEMATKS